MRRLVSDGANRISLLPSSASDAVPSDLTRIPGCMSINQSIPTPTTSSSLFQMAPSSTPQNLQVAAHSPLQLRAVTSSHPRNLRTFSSTRTATPPQSSIDVDEIAPQRPSSTSQNLGIFDSLQGVRDTNPKLFNSVRLGAATFGGVHAVEVPKQNQPRSSPSQPQLRSNPSISDMNRQALISAINLFDDGQGMAETITAFQVQYQDFQASLKGCGIVHCFLERRIALENPDRAEAGCGIDSEARELVAIAPLASFTVIPSLRELHSPHNRTLLAYLANVFAIAGFLVKDLKDSNEPHRVVRASNKSEPLASRLHDIQDVEHLNKAYLCVTRRLCQFYVNLTQNTTAYDGSSR